MANGLFAFHCEANSIAELQKAVQDGLTKLGASAGGAAGGKGAAASSGPKATLDEVKAALTKLKDAVDEKEGADKKLGIKAVKTVLKKFGVTSSTDLEEAKYGEAVAAAEAAMPKEDENF
jgi:hypothetical protein